VLENVGLPLREHTDLSGKEIATAVKEKLALVGLEGIEDKKPAALSGGMRKRVGLARALAMNPETMLYDEPTTGLDPVTAQQINVLIRGLQEQLGITSIVVTHDMASAFQVGDRLCLLHEGRIRFDGTPQEMTKSRDPVVRQFLNPTEAPLPEGLASGLANGALGSGSAS
jgi:phospholipid/cholesterol/gamma-HCH transport system ATP-binding protein